MVCRNSHAGAHSLGKAHIQCPKHIQCPFIPYSNAFPLMTVNNFEQTQMVGSGNLHLVQVLNNVGLNLLEKNPLILEYQIKCIYIALHTSADISKCCTETQPKIYVRTCANLFNLT
jgi:hypothetical protein